MRFAIVIPTYGRPDRILKTVKSVLNQTYYDFEIIVVDDNGRGTDKQLETERVLQTIQSKKLRYIIKEKNGGACSARNVGISNSDSEYIAFLDDDDIWSKDYLKEVNSIIEKNNEVRIVYCDFYRRDEDVIYFNPQECHYQGNIFKQLIGGWCPATTSLFCIKKECFDLMGTFDEKLGNLEEYDLWIRLSQNYKFDYIPQKLVIKDESKHNQLTNNYLSRFNAYAMLIDKYKETLQPQDYSILQKNISNEMQNTYVKYIFSCINDGMKASMIRNMVRTLDIKHKMKLYVELVIGRNLVYRLKRKYVKIRGRNSQLNNNDVEKLRVLFSI